MTLIEDVKGAVKRAGLTAFCRQKGIDVDDVCQDVIERSLRRKKGVAYVDGTQRERYALRAVRWMVFSQARAVARRGEMPAETESTIPNPEEIAIERERIPDVALVLSYASADPMLRALLGGATLRQAAVVGGRVSATTTMRRRNQFVEKAKKDLRITGKYAGSCVY